MYTVLGSGRHISVQRLTSIKVIEDFPESGDTVQPGSEVSLHVLVVPSCPALGSAGAQDGIGSH